jgi:hypothetical protein
MKILIVTYDLLNPGQNYEKLIQKIKSYPAWARLGGSSYLIATDATVIQVRDNLGTVLDRNDKLFVGTCPVPSAWHGLPEDVAKWILENQPKHS